MDQDGEALTIVTAEDHTFELNIENLESILLKNDLKDKKVVILSVAGAFRKGKSFLLNFILRYLKAKGDPKWLGEDDEPLKGFSWRGGSERDTTGILLWSKVFFMPLESGEEVAVLLMDTQGAFDSSSSVKECATVFALSTMISSIQVYNLSQNIQEDDLQHLELFTEYGRLAVDSSGDKPFQKLLFLVRDWCFPYEADYGEEGGQQILKRRLEISDKQHPQLQQLRKHIGNCFGEIGCFLMPHPGLEVARNPNFDGRLADILPDFTQKLPELMQLLLAPSHLLPKQIGGRYITTQDLLSYFKAYIQIFKGGELPEPKSILNATAEANNLSAVAHAKDFYKGEMEKICGGDRPYVNPETLDKKHLEMQTSALSRFSETKKMGSEDLALAYRDQLAKELEEMYTSFVSFNDSKQIANAVRTPGTLLFLIGVGYINSTLFGALGLEAFALLINLFTLATLLALLAWGYARYTGEAQHVTLFIDSLVCLFLNNFVFPSQKHISLVLQRGIDVQKSVDNSPSTSSSSTNSVHSKMN